MKKYKITLSGRGADCYVYHLTDDQYQKLDEGGVSEDKMSMDEILEVLGTDFISDTDDIVLGAYYDSDLHYFSVHDENGNLVWESNQDWDAETNEEFPDWEIVHDEEKTLICEDILKGEFSSFILETEEDFDPTKLTVIVEEVGEIVALITGVRYDGQKLEVDEFGDYWDKGFNFYLI